MFVPEYVYGMKDRTKTILCAIDFSESSIHALRWAVEIAVLLEAHLTIVYPYRLIRTGTGGEVIRMKKAIEEEAVRNFGPLEQDILGGLSLSYDFRPEVGFISDRVRDYARKQPLSFLVMGKMLGEGGAELMQNLVEEINVPVVIVP
jgi:nucleotide-binding universal stress UspA family protein